MDRDTCLVVDSDGRIYVAVGATAPNIHSDKDAISLFVAENKVFGKCEVKQISDRLICVECRKS